MDIEVENMLRTFASNVAKDYWICCLCTGFASAERVGQGKWVGHLQDAVHMAAARFVL